MKNVSNIKQMYIYISAVTIFPFFTYIIHGDLTKVNKYLPSQINSDISSAPWAIRNEWAIVQFSEKNPITSLYFYLFSVFLMI